MCLRLILVCITVIIVNSVISYYSKLIFSHLIIMFNEVLFNPTNMGDLPPLRLQRDSVPGARISGLSGVHKGGVGKGGLSNLCVSLVQL